MHRPASFAVAIVPLLLLSVPRATALDYAYAPYNQGRMDPQTTGWPLTEAERAYALLPEYDRRPGRENDRHEPALWPVTPAAGFFGGTSWLDTHTRLVETARARRGPIDVLLVGDSITMQWGDSWNRHFPRLATVNIGIGGDKTQNVLWRLDHGGVEGLEPRIIVLLIGNNNMFFTPETGVPAAVRGIGTCVANLREKFPRAAIILVKVFPANAPGSQFHEDIRKVNAALDGLGLEADPKLRVLDIWGDLVTADGTLDKRLFLPDNVHLSAAGYDLYAEKLRPLIEAFLAGKDVPRAAGTAAAVPAATPVTATAASPPSPAPAASVPALRDPKPVPRVQAVPQPRDEVSFECAGRELVRLHHGGDLRRPFLYPVVGPAGVSLTRLGHPHDPVSHSHHNSVWLSHALVNGVDFWGDKGGRITDAVVTRLTDGDDAAAVELKAVWRAPDGAEQCRETRTITVVPLAGREWLLVVDAALEAGAGDVAFGDTAFGLIGVRMRKSIGVKDGGGTIRNSAGGVDEAGCFRKPARWVDYSGPATPDAIEGVTLFDHPDNPGHPVAFHVRDDGWMGACLSHGRPIDLPRGDRLAVRYGLWVHAGLPAADAIEARWREFAARPRPAVAGRPAAASK
jgi:lysophospholipase L1-like esterase